MSEFKTPFAIDSTGILIDPSNAQKGVSYTCPVCNEKNLRLRGGEKVKNHFYHINNVNCNNESAIHKAYKQIIKEERKITIPLFRGHLETLEFDNVELEVPFNNRRIDVVGYIGEVKVFIEIAYTHKMEQDKINEIRSENIMLIEVHAKERYSKFDLVESLSEWHYNNVLHDPRQRYIEPYLDLLRDEIIDLRSKQKKLENHLYYECKEKIEKGVNHKEFKRARKEFDSALCEIKKDIEKFTPYFEDLFFNKRSLGFKHIKDFDNASLFKSFDGGLIAVYNKDSDRIYIKKDKYNTNERPQTNIQRQRIY